MALLGEDGRGYELARKLESQGIWRSWLGDALYSSFIPFLSSPAAWDSFMLPDDSKSRPQISLELRARALLFDKASVSLFAQPTALSNLNPNCDNCFYLELHGDDVYFTLENGGQDVDQRHPGVAASSATSSKGRSNASGVGSRFSEPDVDAVSQRLRLEELPETWYNQFFEKYRATKSYTLMFGDRDSEKRTPEQMSTYLSLIENHKRRRLAFVDNISSLRSNPAMVDGSPADDAPLFPETMSIFNCVPDSAVLITRRLENNQKVPFNGVLDNLPQTMTKSPVMSPIMIERLGIRPEYLSMEQGQGWGKNDTSLEVIAQLLTTVKPSFRFCLNMDGRPSLRVPMEVLLDLTTEHHKELTRSDALHSKQYQKKVSFIIFLLMGLKKIFYTWKNKAVQILKLGEQTTRIEFFIRFGSPSVALTPTS
ncbi:hypothetical protein SASPL_145056 [Salvia splendens]|uniref:Uncharacterized protein n=1 Tax=Salvia splendens TaxID=180675 RepID=A0A8X8WIC7_SALSN|nr:hypothetical protein SASPL_145056 [Salvia splendens]